MDRSRSQRVLLVTEDPALAEVVHRIAAAAGVDVQETTSGALTQSAWTNAALLIVAADVLEVVAEHAFPRRPGVVVVADSVHERLWPTALGIGAEHVVELPTGEPWLIGRLGDLADGPSRAGTVIAVTSTTGGVGVTTIATAVAASSAGDDLRTMLIDFDPWSGGIDLAIGAEHAPGIRWGDLADAAGRLSSATLDYALPHVRGIAVLAQPRTTRPLIGEAALAAVIDAGRRGYDQIVCDVPHVQRPDVLATADHVIACVAPTVRGVVGAAQVLRLADELDKPVSLVVRQSRRTLPLDDIGQALGGREILVVPEFAPLVERMEHGDPHVRTDAYGKAIDALRRRFTDHARRAA